MAKHKLAYALPIAAMALGAGVLMPSVAFADARDLTGDLTLEGNVEDCYTVKSGSEVTLDLNGYNIECTKANAIMVENGAKLTIKGNGNVNAATSGKAAIYNNIGGTVVVEGGSYSSANWYTVKNLGKMTINGGAFNQDSSNASNSSLIDNGWYDSTKTNGSKDQGNAHTGDILAEMTINGGTFNHLTETSTIKSDDYSKTVINNGEFNSKNGFLIQATGDVTVNDGKFTGYSSMIVFNATGAAGYEPGIATINGGEVSASYIAFGSKGVLKITGGNFSNLVKVVNSGDIAGDGISGGTFNVEPEASRIAEGYVAVYNNGRFEVINPAELDPADEIDTEIIDDEEVNVVRPKQIDWNEEWLDSVYDDDKYVSVEFGKSLTADRKATLSVAEADTAGLTLDATKTEAALVKAIDIKMLDRDGVVIPVSDNEIKVYIDITDEEYAALAAYDKVAVIYFDENGNEAERIDAELKGEQGYYWVEFTTSHFSTYGIAGVNEEAAATTPETGTVTAAGASAMSAAILTAVAVGVIVSIVSFAMLVRRK